MNIQETIVRGITELLYKQDYLVLPGFGGFVLKSQQAVFSESGTLLLPPSKKLGFNKQLRQNDGVLLNWLQSELACEHSTALQHLEEFSDYCNSILTTKRRLSIERLGFFYLDFENNLCFEPRTDVNFLSESFGLGPLHVKEIEREPEVQEVKSGLFTDRVAPPPSLEPAPVRQVRGIRNIRKTLAYTTLSVFMLFAIGYVITTVGIRGPLKASLFNQSVSSRYALMEYKPLKLLNEQSDGVVFIKTSETASILKLGEKTRFVVSSSFSEKAERHATETTVAGKNNYQLVFGCFSIKDNAEKYARKLKENNVSVSISALPGKNMHVVSLGGFQAKSQAKAKWDSLKTLYPQIWIKKIH